MAGRVGPGVLFRAPPLWTWNLTDRKGAWALEEMEQGMAEHWMGCRRAVNRHKLAGGGDWREARS